MNIATQTGDGGQTGLSGDLRVSKADIRIEAHGTIDELISSLGFARAIFADVQTGDLIRSLQRDLFRVGSAVIPPAEIGEQTHLEITDEMVDRLTREVDRIQETEGLLNDWTLPGEDVASAAFDVARTVCRRTERLVVRMQDEGIQVEANSIRYLNRLSDLLWLLGRLVETKRNVRSGLRDDRTQGPAWSRAW